MVCERSWQMQFLGLLGRINIPHNRPLSRGLLRKKRRKGMVRGDGRGSTIESNLDRLLQA